MAVLPNPIGRYSRLQICVTSSPPQAGESAQGICFLSFTDSRFAHRLGEHGDVLIVSLTINWKRMPVFASVRVGVIGPFRFRRHSFQIPANGSLCWVAMSNGRAI